MLHPGLPWLGCLCGAVGNERSFSFDAEGRSSRPRPQYIMEELNMSGDKELFEMMASRNTRSGQLPSKSIHFIPEETADSVLKINERIQKIRKNQGWFITGAIAFAFLLGVCV